MHLLEGAPYRLRINDIKCMRGALIMTQVVGKRFPAKKNRPQGGRLSTYQEGSTDGPFGHAQSREGRHFLALTRVVPVAFLSCQFGGGGVPLNLAKVSQMIQQSSRLVQGESASFYEFSGECASFHLI